MRRSILAAGVAALLLATQAHAQAPAPAPAPAKAAAPAATAPAAKKAAPAATKPRSAESIECSKQADAKGLHGKERKKFRATCIKDLKKNKKG